MAYTLQTLQAIRSLILGTPFYAENCFLAGILQASDKSEDHTVGANLRLGLLLCKCCNYCKYDN